MPVTQVADSCGIPRPSMTQLLKGRNQKISDDVLRKLHARFPSLNILWLLCGEGDMLVGENIAASGPQNDARTGFSETEQPDPQLSQQTIDFGSDTHSGTVIQESTENGVVNEPFAGVNTVSDEDPVPYGRIVRPKNEPSKTTISFAPESGAKKIVNIIIYYSDNSFEAFVPKDQH